MAFWPQVFPLPGSSVVNAWECPPHPHLRSCFRRLGSSRGIKPGTGGHLCLRMPVTSHWDVWFPWALSKCVLNFQVEIKCAMTL